MSIIPKGLFQAPLFLSMNTGIHHPVTQTINHPPHPYHTADDIFSNTLPEIIFMEFLWTASWRKSENRPHLRQLGPVHIPTTYTLNSYFNIILSSVSLHFLSDLPPVVFSLNCKCKLQTIPFIFILKLNTLVILSEESKLKSKLHNSQSHVLSICFPIKIPFLSQVRQIKLLKGRSAIADIVIIFPLARIRTCSYQPAA
jgi:hypothetical protein